MLPLESPLPPLVDLQPFVISKIMLFFTVPPLASPLITIKFPPCLTFDQC